MPIHSLLQECLEHWKQISELDYCLLYPDETIIVHTDSNYPVPDSHWIQEFLSSDKIMDIQDERQLYKVYTNKELMYLLYIYGKKEEAHTIGKLAVCQVESLLLSIQEKLDRNSFIFQLLQGNYSETDLCSLAKKAHVSLHIPRAIFIIETKEGRNENALKIVRNIFSSKSKDFVTSFPTHEIVIVKELEEHSNMDDLYQLAYMLVDMLNTEIMTSAWVSFSHITNHLEELPLAFRDARNSLEIGKIFYAQKTVFCYEHLGIGRLIYNIPDAVCTSFIREVFQAETPDSIDDETLRIIKVFFENNLNLSETARQLFVHRNTLVYRLEKIQKKYNLDLRSFEDALIFKLALMVSDYLKFKDKSDLPPNHVKGLV